MTNEHLYVRQGTELSYNDVWQFFDKITDVNSLDASEEQGVPWVTETENGEIVGIAVVDTIPDDYAFVCRIAVKKRYRRQGVATRLIQTLVDNYDRLVCRVAKCNTPSIKLMESTSFKCLGKAYNRGLLRYDTHPPDDKSVITNIRPEML